MLAVSMKPAPRFSKRWSYDPSSTKSGCEHIAITSAKTTMSTYSRALDWQAYLNERAAPPSRHRVDRRRWLLVPRWHKLTAIVPADVVAHGT
jgi:hypothetical protein